MLRPVGNRVPLPGLYPFREYPWTTHYQTVLMDSGTSSLAMAMKAAAQLHPGRNDPEVILPAYGCPDLIAAADSQGIKPVLVDLEPNTPWLDVEQVETAISDNTVAIAATNFLGLRAPLRGLKEVADKHQVALIEDSAQAMPPLSASQPYADFVVLSFGRGKPINLMGGGALLVPEQHVPVVEKLLAGVPERQVVCDSVWRMKRLMYHALMSRWLYGLMLKLPFLRLGETHFSPLEVSSRLSMPKDLISSGIQAQTTRLPLRGRYADAFRDLEGSGWRLLPEMLDTFTQPDSAHGMPGESAAALLRYPMLAPNPDSQHEAIKRLQEGGIAANAFYGTVLPNIPGVERFLRQSSSDFPNAMAFASCLVTIPCHDGVTPQDIRNMAELMR